MTVTYMVYIFLIAFENPMGYQSISVLTKDGLITAVDAEAKAVDTVMS